MRTKTKFEIGRRYRALGGWIGTVTEISNWDGRLHVTHDRLDMSGKFVLKTSNLPDGRFNNEGCEGEHENDLLLPAIEPEGEPAGLSVETRLAVLAYGNFWRHFHKLVSANEWDPCAGCSFSLTHHDRVSIAGTYSTREAALSESTAVIAAIDRLLEGGPAK